MPIFNINSIFAERKKTTVPVIRLPQNVKQALGISAAHENGIFRCEPESGAALFDSCYLFEDINYKNKDIDKKKTTLLQFMELFRVMDGQFKITVASSQRDMDTFVDEIFCPVHGAEYPVVEKGIRAWINQKIDEGTRDIQRILLLTVTCRAASFADAAAYFSTLDVSLSNIFRNLRSRIIRLNGYERLALIQRMARGDETCMDPYSISPEDDAWKNQIMPQDIVQDIDYMLFSNRRYVSVLFGHDYAQTMDEEKVLHSLSDVTFPTYVTLDMQRVPKKLVKERLLSAHVNNEKLISQERIRNVNNRQYGAGTSYTLEKKKEELELTMDQVEDNDEEGIFLGLLVMVEADSLEELTRRVETLKQQAKDFTIEPYNHRQLKAFNTVLPIGGRQVNHMRFLYSSSAVAFQPFYASDLQDKNGIVYGMNRTTKHLLRGDRKKLPAPHGFMIGHTGGGKSFLLKETEISQPLIMTDDDIIILDPNNEQKKYICSLPGGQYFDFTPQSEIYMNPFEIPEHVKKGDVVTRNMFVAKMVEYTVSFCIVAMKNIVVTQIHMNFMERAVRAMYDKYFDAKPFRKEPTMIVFREQLKKMAEGDAPERDREMIRDIVSCLEIYTDGVYDMFAHPSNLKLNSRIVGFGLKNIPESVWEAAMLSIMHFLSMRIDMNQKDKVALRLIVDEAQVLCKKPTTAEQLLYAVETYRKVGAIVTLAAQNLTYVLENKKMRDMFSNCPYKCFLDQGGIDGVNLAQIQELSTTESLALVGDDQGKGVLVWGNQVYLFDAVMAEDNILFDYFNTDFHKKAKKRRKKKAEEIDLDYEKTKEEPPCENDSLKE